MQKLRMWEMSVVTTSHGTGPASTPDLRGGAYGGGW
jgi:hypothetical protein